MPRPRRETVSSTEKGVYHIRCEFTQGLPFLGQDPICNQFCGYRRQWVIDKCNHLCRTFPVTILSITVRTCGYDTVLRIDPTLPRKWSDREVVEHWSSYFILRRDEADKRRELTEDDFEEILADTDLVASWRERLCHLGGFMQELNGRIASRINRENGGDGAVWARRYDAIPLLDELAIVTALVNTAAEAVECRTDGTLQVTPYSTAHKYLHPTQSGWVEEEKPIDYLEWYSEEIRTLTKETLWRTVEVVVDWLTRPYLVASFSYRTHLDSLIGHLVADTGLWFYHWIKQKDLPRRALGAPSLLAALATKLSLKCLHLSWLGNGIYKGTKNEPARRNRRIKRLKSSLPNAPNHPAHDPPSPG